MQSYAGKYIPAICYKIHMENPSAKIKINLKGMAMGDGFSAPAKVRKLDERFFLLLGL